MRNPGLWMVGVVTKWIGEDAVWEFAGVFDTEAEAKTVCEANGPFAFIAPVELNDAATAGEAEEFPGSWYPALEERPR